MPVSAGHFAGSVFLGGTIGLTSARDAMKKQLLIFLKSMGNVLDVAPSSTLLGTGFRLRSNVSALDGKAGSACDVDIFFAGRPVHIEIPKNGFSQDRTAFRQDLEKCFHVRPQGTKSRAKPKKCRADQQASSQKHGGDSVIVRQK